MRCLAGGGERGLPTPRTANRGVSRRCRRPSAIANMFGGTSSNASRSLVVTVAFAAAFIALAGAEKKKEAGKAYEKCCCPIDQAVSGYSSWCLLAYLITLQLTSTYSSLSLHSHTPTYTTLELHIFTSKITRPEAGLSCSSCGTTLLQAFGPHSVPVDFPFDGHPFLLWDLKKSY